MAEGIPRREALRRVIGVLAGAVLGTLELAGPAVAGTRTSVCNQYCASQFTDSHDRNVCKSICQSCPSVTLLCGRPNDINSLVCCTSGTCCNGSCVDLASNQSNCGACGNVCAPGLHCVGGACSCPFGASLCFSPTTGAPYCTDLSTDPYNCGQCANVCPQGMTCSGGVCVGACSAPKTLCPKGSCVDLSSDPLNCGACGTVCPQGYRCSGGKCQPVCPPQQTNCGGACVDLSSDPNNCGACGVVCPTGQMCVAGVCQPSCPTGYTVCNGACVDLSSSILNCGACGHACDAPNAVMACVNGACVIQACNYGYADCNNQGGDGCEVNVLSDPNNCGGCGIRCVTGGTTIQQCIKGVCMSVTPSCGDGIRNGNETDVDCGGGVCPPCADFRQCRVGADCQSGVCVNGICQAPTCFDGVQNGTETDIDCGGGSCAPCSFGEKCLVGTDCGSGRCVNGFCSA
jgi:hypothetical protein